MTVAIPEAAAAGGGSAAGASRAGSASAGTRTRARQRRPTEAEMGRGGTPRGGRARTGERGQRGAAGASGPRGDQGRAAPASKPERKPEKRSQSRRRQVAGRLTGASTRPGPALHNYQAIIAAEYVTATLLVVISPFATRKAQLNPASGKVSPYLPADIIKIFAIGIVYLILEGMAAGPRGLARFSAWFGALILLAVGLTQVANLAKIFQTISGGGYNPVQLTGAEAPVVKGSVTIPPLGQGPPAKTPPPPAAGGVP